MWVSKRIVRVEQIISLRFISKKLIWAITINTQDKPEIHKQPVPSKYCYLRNEIVFA